MYKNIEFFDAMRILADLAAPVGAESVPVSNCAGRVLAEDITAKENVTPFDRSPYDGYAFRASDTEEASKERPAVLEILEEIAAGGVAHYKVTPGKCVKILTGAPIPEGADAVTKYEDTQFDEKAVKIFSPFKSGDNIVRLGEDVMAGTVLAESGIVIDAATAGAIASQGKSNVLVYKKPRVGVISTGNELVEVEEAVGEGKIRNSNRYSLEAACILAGCEPVFLGIAKDEAEDIAALMKNGLDFCDILISTGGVSVGDYDFTAKAIEKAGAEIVIKDVSLKPGGKCAYGHANGKLICSLSGNPASSITNFYAVAMAGIRKLSGRKDVLPREIQVTLDDDFPKKSPQTRLLRGMLDITDGTVKMKITGEQGNAVLHSMIGCNVLAVVPAGTGKLCRGAVLKAFTI
jgi:molybdopterin molybdotransferase